MAGLDTDTSRTKLEKNSALSAMRSEPPGRLQYMMCGTMESALDAYAVMHLCGVLRWESLSTS
jgi:hypothetical protein